MVNVTVSRFACSSQTTPWLSQIYGHLLV